jgi:hypothetical protein
LYKNNRTKKSRHLERSSKIVKIIAGS